MNLPRFLSASIVRPLLGIVLLSVTTLPILRAQQTTPAAVPPLITFSGKVVATRNLPLLGVAQLTFSVYADQYNGAPLWIESQNVAIDAKGNYTVQLGITKSAGLPLDLFSSGEERWIGIRVDASPEQPRVMLLSVPFAFKAADSATLGGLPASAFLLATSAASSNSASAPRVQSSANSPTPASDSITGSGTTNFVPLFTGTTTIGNSALFQTGASPTAKLGINNPKPAASLDVVGSASIRGPLGLPSTGSANATAGKNSQPLNLAAAVFNSTSKASVNETFRWQAEPASNNTAAPRATLNLLFGQGTTAPAETGLHISSTGILSFAPGQIFPGTGTITGVSAGTGLTGGGTAGTVALNLDTTKIPQLNTANLFVGSQSITGDLSATGVINSNSLFEIGGAPYASGSSANETVYVGMLAGNGSSALGSTAVGYAALAANTVGASNAAFGAFAMHSNVNGIDNTAVGALALEGNVVGTYNTAVGYGAAQTINGEQDALTIVGTHIGTPLPAGQYNTLIGYQTNSTLANSFNSTAIGAFATVAESQALVLGGSGSNAVSVGIGTPTPYNDYGLTVNTTPGNAINGGIVSNASTGNEYLGMTNGVHKFRVDVNGVVYADGGYQSSGADFAESVAVRGLRSEYEPGDVLEIDSTADRHLTLSHHRYASLVAGIYSTKPGLLASPHHIEDPTIAGSEVPLAVMGIVPCKVTTENGPIARGDLLVTSSRPGYAMKGTDRKRMLGAVVGKALEPLAKGIGSIEVLVTLQ